MLRFLRVHPEPFEYVDERTVHAALTAYPAGFLGFLEERLSDIASSRATLALPPKVLFSGAGGGDFRVMPCVTSDEHGTVKTVKVVGTNLEQARVPDQITVGKAFCLHPDENYVSHIIEACLLSSARTGACAALAVKRLAPGSRKVTVVGAGRVGLYAGLYLSTLRGIEELVIRDLLPGRAQALAELGPRRLAAGRVRWRAAAAGEPLTGEVVVLATTSSTPLLAPREVSAQLVVSLGADAEDQRELDSSWPEVADVYVDSRDSVRVGDLRAWIGEGAISEQGIGDLVALFRTGLLDEPDRRRVFVSTGSALLDNLAVAYIVERLGAEEAGSPG